MSGQPGNQIHAFYDLKVLIRTNFFRDFTCRVTTHSKSTIWITFHFFNKATVWKEGCGSWSVRIQIVLVVRSGSRCQPCAWIWRKIQWKLHQKRSFSQFRFFSHEKKKLKCEKDLFLRIFSRTFSLHLRAIFKLF